MTADRRDWLAPGLHWMRGGDHDNELGLFVTRDKALAALNACQTPPPDWNPEIQYNRPQPPVDQSEMMRVVESMAARLDAFVHANDKETARLLRAMAKVVEVTENPSLFTNSVSGAKAHAALIASRAELSTLIKSMNTETQA